MRALRTFMLNITPVIADIAILSFVYSLLPSPWGEGAPEIHLMAFVICATAVSMLNCILAHWGRTTLQVALANIVMAAAGEIVMLSTLRNASGLFVYAACAFLFLYPVLRSLSLIRRPATTNTMIKYSQASFFSTACFLFFQHNEFFRPGWGLHALCFASLGMNLTLLLYLRSEDQNARVGHVNGSERWIILVFYMGLLLSLSAVMAFFMLPGTMGMLINMLSHMKNALIWAWNLIKSLYVHLLSILFDTDAHRETIYGEEGFLPLLAESVGEEKTTSPLLGMALLIVALLAWVAHIFRRARLRFGIFSNVCQITANMPSLWRIAGRIFIRLGNQLRFYLLLLFRLRQPAGMFARLERRGGACGCPRLLGQTPREFLEMLSDKTAPEETAARSAFSDLAERLDKLCFEAGGGASLPQRLHCKALPAKQARAMLRVTRRHRFVPKGRIWGSATSARPSQ